MEIFTGFSPDGKFLLFISDRPGGTVVYCWVVAKIIEDLKSEELK
jgi:Tol biopolymer transport system component